MASCSGNSSSGGSSVVQNSGSEEELQVLMDERKRKRMQSNRESARRSRMRKQKHLDDLMAQVTQLRKENSQILSSINITAEQYLRVEADNSILRAQLVELGQRLDSLNDILNFILNTAATPTTSTSEDSTGVFQSQDLHTGLDDHLLPCFMNPQNFVHFNQPIMASPDLFQY